MPGMSEQLSTLPRMSKLELQKLWNQLFRNSPNCQLRRELMIRVLAHEIQKRECGGLSDRYRRQLHGLLRANESNLSCGTSGTSMPCRIKPGTRLIREWNNQAHVVTVEERGFQYQGARYESLSEIARAITGTRWSGPLFFGLKDKKVKPMESRNEC